MAEVGSAVSTTSSSSGGAPPRTAKLAAHSVLTGSDATLGLARKQLITLKGVMLPTFLQNQPGGYDKLSDFEQGFVDAILTRVGSENRRVASLKANHDDYLRQSAGRSMPR